MTTTKKGDCVEITFTGYHDGNVFDSNIPEELKKLNPDAKEPEKTIVIIGQDMVVPGLDNALEGKELEKEYKVHVAYKDGFGPRKRELIKTIPLNVFTKQKINPRPGMPLFLDNALARVITVSGARVMTDFNNPLAGKDLDYTFTIKRVITEEKEKLESFFKFFFKTIPQFDTTEKDVTVKGPKPFEHIIDLYKEKFKEIFNKTLVFKEETPKPSDDEKQAGPPQEENN